MTSRDFAYWLQGFFEISKPIKLNPEETQLIQKHLNLVFRHEIDPSMGDAKHQEVLNQIHEGFKIPSTEEEAIAAWGPKPSVNHKFNLHGWYNPEEGTPRC